MYEKLQDEFNGDLIFDSLAHLINSETKGWLSFKLGTFVPVLWGQTVVQITLMLGKTKRHKKKTWAIKFSLTDLRQDSLPGWGLTYKLPFNLELSGTPQTSPQRMLCRVFSFHS